SNDILPSPIATLTTGITPQMTQQDGITEAELASLLMSEIFTPDTIAVGYNNIRFDDEFIRNLFFRSFYDAYAWAWADNRSRWDLLDVVRMTRALRPGGIKWTERDGKQSNKLTDLSSANGLEHLQAHDALSDVLALISVARLLKAKQPQIFDYLLGMRDKKQVERLVMAGEPFVYASGRYSHPSKTTVAVALGKTPQGALVYDLRVDPAAFLAMSEAELQAHLQVPYKERPEGYVPLPVKELKFNRCPAVAPLSVLKPDDLKRLGLEMRQIQANLGALAQDKTFVSRVEAALERPPFPPSSDPDRTLYDSFVPDADKPKMEAVRNANEQTLSDFNPEFNDERLAKMLPLYKARNFPRSLTKSEAAIWHDYRTEKIKARLPEFQKEMAIAMRSLSDQPGVSDHQELLLEELALWLEDITA
ncbi:exodeoxyribonuclease I, partial [Candidatus Saccharibacteria bacterium]|nr:exodeoxyribonuclease I [Candidatus Saccharibacteria bacterium]